VGREVAAGRGRVTASARQRRMDFIFKD